MNSKFFTNKEENTLINKIEGILNDTSQIYSPDEETETFGLFDKQLYGKK